MKKEVIDRFHEALEADELAAGKWSTSDPADGSGCVGENFIATFEFGDVEIAPDGNGSYQFKYSLSHPRSIMKGLCHRMREAGVVITGFHEVDSIPVELLGSDD